MSLTFVACAGIAFAWMTLFYVWGRAFLMAIHAGRDFASSVAFGYLILQVIYQLIYLPFYLTRGSYRSTTHIWLIISGIGSILLLVYIRKQGEQERYRLKAHEKLGVIGAVILIIGLAVYISLHVPFYGTDTVTYISTMNESYYRDTMWIRSGELQFHFGMCSMFQFFTISSLVSGIRPYYIFLFTVRIVGICLSSLIIYRTGLIVFRKNDKGLSWSAIALAVIVPYFLMFWGSMYTAEFFYWRISEAKGFCQFVLLPLAFSVFLAMFNNHADRKKLWKQQLLVGLSAISVSASSLTPYLFLLLLGTVALLAYDKLKHGWRTMCLATICAVPNLIYLIVYVLEKKELLAL